MIAKSIVNNHQAKRFVRVNKKLKKVLVLIVTLLLGLWTLDYFDYKVAGVASCASDHLYGHIHALTEYSDKHDKQLPKSLDEVSSAIPVGYKTCTGSRKPYVYLASELHAKGYRVVLMCPRNSHGFIRRFSYGLAYDGQDFLVVRILSNNVIVRLQGDPL